MAGDDNILQMPDDMKNDLVQPGDTDAAMNDPFAIAVAQTRAMESIADSLDVIALYFERKGKEEGLLTEDDLNESAED